VTHEKAVAFPHKLVARTDTGEDGKTIRFERVGESIQTFISHSALSQVVIDGLHWVATDVLAELRAHAADLRTALVEHDHSPYDCDTCEDRREISVPAPPPRDYDELVDCPECVKSSAEA
jgi:hypothetical protein